MDKILHQLIGSLSQYLQGFIHTRRCRISSINSSWLENEPGLIEDVFPIEYGDIPYSSQAMLVYLRVPFLFNSVIFRAVMQVDDGKMKHDFAKGLFVGAPFL